MKVVIVGGGVIGLLSALVLAQAGCQVTILEKNSGAVESSWAGGGIVSPMYPWRYPPAVTALAQLAQAEYPLLAQQLIRHDRYQYRAKCLWNVDVRGRRSA